MWHRSLHGRRGTFTRRELIRRTKKPPKTLQWRLECLGHSMLEGIAMLLPGPLVFRFGEMLERALIWLGDVPDTWRPAENWFHPDVIYEAAIFAGSHAPEWLPEGALIHSLTSPESARDIESVICSLDSTSTLPFDFIITRKASPALAEAAAAGLIPLVSLP